MHPWSNELLDRLRQEADPKVDAGVARLLAAQKGGELYRFLQDKGPCPTELREILGANPPGGVDRARLARGQSVYGRHAVPAMLGLLGKGLPEAYAAPHGAQILLSAGRFARQPRERLMETARFFIAMMEPGQLGQAREEVLKVRLVHALSRRMIATSELYHPELGLPINQEDLIGTLLSFSTLVLDAFPRLGVFLTPEEEEDYFYVWQTVAWYLGINPEYIPDDVLDGRAFFGWVRQRHQQASPAGAVLTKALLEALEELVPGRMLDFLPTTLMVYLCGPKVAGYLGLHLEEDRLATSGLRALGRLTDLIGNTGTLAGPAEQLGRAIFQLVYQYGSSGRRPVYQPPSQT